MNKAECFGAKVEKRVCVRERGIRIQRRRRRRTKARTMIKEEKRKRQGYIYLKVLSGKERRCEGMRRVGGE